MNQTPVTAAAASPNPARTYAVTPPATGWRTPSAANVIGSGAEARAAPPTRRPTQAPAACDGERRHEQHAGPDQRTHVERRAARDAETMGVEFRHGFRAMMPLWLGVAPFAFAYAVLARNAGLSLVETQALSLLVFAGSAQVSAVGLFGRGAGGLEIVLTTFLLNVRHVLYGMSLGRVVPMTRRERLVGAYLLTDEAYGVSVARGARTFPFVLGDRSEPVPRLERDDARGRTDRRCHP